MDELQLGSKIQQYRRARGLSVRKLAAQAGITPSMLSQIENGQVNPSINTLRAVAQKLGVPLYVLFQDTPSASPVVHPEDRRIIGSRREPDVRYELLVGAGGSIEFCMMVLPPHRSSYRDAQSHTGEEVAYVQTGRVDLELDGTTYSLCADDSVRIPPNSPHIWHNPTNEPTNVIFAITPPTF